MLGDLEQDRLELVGRLRPRRQMQNDFHNVPPRGGPPLYAAGNGKDARPAYYLCPSSPTTLTTALVNVASSSAAMVKDGVK